MTKRSLPEPLQREIILNQAQYIDGVIYEMSSVHEPTTERWLSG